MWKIEKLRQNPFEGLREYLKNFMSGAVTINLGILN